MNIKLVFSFLVIYTLFSCSNETKELMTQNKNLELKIDSLNKELTVLKNAQSGLIKLLNEQGLDVSYNIKNDTLIVFEIVEDIDEIIK